MFHVEKLRSEREDTAIGRRKVYYIDDIRVVSTIDIECLSDKELHETKQAAGKALSRLDELRERDKPDRSQWPLYGVVAIGFLLAAVNFSFDPSSKFFIGWLAVALLTAAYPLIKLLITQRFTTMGIKINEIFTQCAIELAKRSDT